MPEIRRDPIFLLFTVIMSFLAASEDTMIFELWPKAMKNEFQRLQGDNDYASWELFPASLQDMAKWADIYQDHKQRDKLRDCILIYKEVPDTEPGTIYPVAIRLHGILGKFRVERFRNWSGREADIARAVQYVNISSGGQQKPWEATFRSLNLACEYVSRRLHLPTQGIACKKEIYSQRRVFIKRDQPRKSKELALTATQDPEGKYICVQDLWNVVRPLTVANLTDTGKVVPMDAVLLTEGDFMDPSEKGHLMKFRKELKLVKEEEILLEKHNTLRRLTMTNIDPNAISPMTVCKRGGGATQPTLSVRTVIPNPTKLLIDEGEVKDYGNELKARLHKLSNYTNEKANVYALGRLLPTAMWGQYKAVNDRSKTLCDPATGEPLTIWVVGHITRMWFAKRGVPESQASITILPLTQNLARQSTHLLAKFSSPVLAVNEQTTHNIRAIKWQNARNDDIQTEAILFDSVYDARGEGSLKTYDE
ncbi:hypothetical protein C8R48DRAFT_776018 [Suillus tomentosus]|nr:hypothetical protein C8R48DRAFT_776018 [Suillus tomentosus]